jgi:hypothetical protein
MEFSLKKGYVHTPITYINDFCNNLFSKNVILKIDDFDGTITFRLDYYHIYLQQHTVYQNYFLDVQELEEHLPDLRSLQLSEEPTIIKRLKAIIHRKHSSYKWMIELVLSKTHIFELKNIEIINKDINLTILPN